MHKLGFDIPIKLRKLSDAVRTCHVRMFQALFGTAPSAAAPLRAAVTGTVLHCSVELKPSAQCYRQLREGRSRWSWETVASLALRYSTATGSYSSWSRSR